MKSSKKVAEENSDIAQAIVDVRSMMRSILSDPIVGFLNKSSTSSSQSISRKSLLENSFSYVKV